MFIKLINFVVVSSIYIFLLSRLRDVLSEVQNKKQEYEKAHNCEIVKYEKCIEDLKQNVDSVKEKIIRTDDINENTYRKIWKFNEKRVGMFLKEVRILDVCS